MSDGDFAFRSTCEEIRSLRGGRFSYLCCSEDHLHSFGLDAFHPSCFEWYKPFIEIEARNYWNLSSMEPNFIFLKPRFILFRLANRGRVEDLVAETSDHLHYIDDIFTLGVTDLTNVLCLILLRRLFLPIYVHSLTKRHPPKVSLCLACINTFVSSNIGITVRRCLLIIIECTCVMPFSLAVLFSCNFWPESVLW